MAIPRRVSDPTAARTIGRRTLLAGGAVLGAALVAGCNDEADGGQAAGASGTASPKPTGRTPVKHPSGLSYGPWLRANSHVLDAGAAKSTLVEFLDFECEACGAVFPLIEQLRKEFEGDLTYAIRYLPLPGHVNSRPAAHAVEAAARQGKLQQMYHQMFANQQRWGEQQGSVGPIFESFARDSGLDLQRWQRDRGSASVAARVTQDFDDAQRLKLKGTPSFFLNGKPFAPTSPDDLRQRLRDVIG